MRRLLSAARGMFHHLPTLLFLSLLALAVFWLPPDEFSQPIAAETKATDIVWSRHTEAGKVAQIKAPYLHRQADGIVSIQDIIIEAQHDENTVSLMGKQGVTDGAYQQISLSAAHAELDSADGRVTLSLKSAVYRLDGGNLLRGEQVDIHQHSNIITGDFFLWEGSEMKLYGNVQASYRLEDANNALK